MNGYEFVKDFLSQHNFDGMIDVGPLISYAGNEENEWLEFKAVVCEPENERGPGETEADYYWHIAKAALAMLNGTGGVILIGVTNEGALVSANKRPQYSEAYIREDFFSKVFNRKEWRTGTMGIWASTPKYLKCFHNNMEPGVGWLQEQPVLAVYIKPSDENIYVQELVKDKTKHDEQPIYRPALYARKKGGIGWSHPYFNADDFRPNHSERPDLEVALNNYKQLLKKDSLQSNNELKIYANKVLHKHFIYDDDEHHEAGRCFHGGVYELPISLRDKSGAPITVADDTRSNRTSDLLEILHERKYVVLTGAAGSGKTTLMRHAVHKAHNENSSLRAKPIYVSLRGYGNDEQLLKFVVRASGISENTLIQSLEDAKVALVFDGAQADSLPTTELNALINKYDKVRILVGIQTSGVEEKFELEKIFGEHEYCFCELLPLKQDRPVQFLDTAFIWSNEDYKRGVSSATLVEAMIANPGVAKLSENPRFLVFAATLVAEQKSLDVITKNRAQIYREYSTKYCADSNDVPLLGKIAFEMCIEDCIWGSRLKLEKREQAMRFLQDTVYQMPLMMSFDENSNKISFAQAEYRDYFAAEFLRACLAEPTNNEEDLKRFGEGGNPDASRWLRVLALLLDLCQEHIGDLLNKNSNFITTLWKADPLFAIFSPIADWQLSDCMEKHPLMRDGWHSGICSILLGNNPETAFGAWERLPYKPDKEQETEKEQAQLLKNKQTRPLISNEWVGYLISRHHDADVRLKRLIEYSKRNLQPCGGMILKYLSRGIDSLKTEMCAECYGWKGMALGENLDKPPETEFLVYLAYGALETHTHLQKGFVSLTNNFALFHAHPEKLGVFLWKRLVEVFSMEGGKNKDRDNKKHFEAAALLYKFRFLTTYPQLASVISDYVVSVWDDLSTDQQKVLWKHLSIKAIIKLSRNFGGGLTDEKLAIIEPHLCDVDSVIELDKNLRIFRGQFTYWNSLDEAKRQLLLEQTGGVRKLLVNGVAQSKCFPPHLISSFVKSASLIELLECLVASSIEWNELPQPNQEGIKNALHHGVVLEEANGEIIFKKIDGDFLRSLATYELREMALTNHWFVMTPPSATGYMCEHPALNRKVYYDRQRIERRIGSDVTFLIGKLEWSTDHDKFTWAIPSLLGISKVLVSKITHGQIEENDQPQSIAEKYELLKIGKCSLSTLHEGEEVVPRFDLNNEYERAEAIRFLSGKTWTLSVFCIIKGQTFIAKHKDGSALEASGWMEKFGVKKKGDIIVAEVSVLDSSGDFKYRVVDCAALSTPA